MTIFDCPNCKVELLIDKEFDDGAIDLICPKCMKYGISIDGDVISLAKSCVKHSKEKVKELRLFVINAENKKI